MRSSTAIAMNLAGGTHHAFPDHGEGFCVFNDVAVAIRALQRDDRIRTRRGHRSRRASGQRNARHLRRTTTACSRSACTAGGTIRFDKVAGRLDVELADGTGDDDTSRRSRARFPACSLTRAPDLVVYLAGADPHERDRLGRLSLTFDGLARRDSMVLDHCREVGLPVVVTIAGGYGTRIEETVDVHVATARIAARYAM